jgi:hypothetical protein
MSTPMATARPQGPAPETDSRNDDALAALGRALDHETEAVRELREALVRQREGVAGDSTDAVLGSCDDIGRLLVTLESSRRHRARLLSAMVPGAEPTLDDLDRSRPGGLPPALAASRDALRAEAEATAREAAVNRVVLQRTVEAGEAFLQALFAGATGAGQPYRAGERREADGSGFLLDRTA